MPVKIFFCYAREDEVLRQGLEKQLRALKRQGIIEMWHDRDISAGTEWEREIDKHLNTAQIILLLVSPDFMDSDYCYGIEMQRAMERHEQGEAHVIPIILRPVYWQKSPFGKLQALPTDAKPLIDPDWHHLDRAFFDVAEGIRKVVEQLPTKFHNPQVIIAMSGSKSAVAETAIRIPEWRARSSGGFTTSNQLRRLPIYFLLDCSVSMSGDPITAVTEGLTMIHREMMDDPQALETVYISIITFSDKADQYLLTPIDQFRAPILQVSGNGERAMGDALRILVQSIEEDLVLNTPSQHGDYRPIVFLLTDGEPTDNYRDAVQRLQALRGSRKPTIIALGCGSGVNTTILHEITENVYLMPNVTLATMKGYFQWLE